MAWGWTLVVVASLVVAGALPLPAQFETVTIVDDGRPHGKLYLPPLSVRGFGRAMASAGDVNDDGKPDLLVSAAPDFDDVPGQVFIIPGNQGGSYLREISPGSSGVIGVRSGSALRDGFGEFVAAAGDIDGDGTDDFLIGMPSQGSPGNPRGGVYAVFGSSHFPAVVDLSAPGQPFSILFTLGQPGPGTLGVAGAGIGDVNGDGVDDIAIGMPGGSTGGNGSPQRTTGKVWVIFGGVGLRTAGPVVLLDDAPPAGILVAGAEEGAELGAAIAGLGDVDGDGIDDFAVGAPGQGTGGSTYVVFGKRPLAEAPDLETVDGTSVVEIRASPTDARAGESLAAGLDATGDGVPDLLIGAPGIRRDGNTAGAAYLIAGGALRGTPLALLPAAAALVLRGAESSSTGRALSLVPDADGDGVADVLVGAFTSRSARGAAYLVRGGLPQGQEIRLEDLAPPDGWAFLANTPGLHLGLAVAGLPDRNGDALGDLALGAPGFGKPGVPGLGAVFEVFLPEDPQSPAPRNLIATILPGSRVQLAWMIGKEYAYVRVYRDDNPISPPLPGTLLRYTDLGPVSGEHEYFIEADGDPDLRSNEVEVEVRGIRVRHLECHQLENSTRVRVSWAPGDLYNALQVYVDGAPATGLLPPSNLDVELDLQPGEHLIEVFDPVAVPEGARESCTVRVETPELPEIEELTCSEESPRQVRLSWEGEGGEEGYESYRIYRNGVRIAEVVGAEEYLDRGVPPGRAIYEVRGVDAGIHPGASATCEVTVSGGGDRVIQGRTAWQGGGAIRVGVLRALDAAGGEVSRAQVSERGEFRLDVPAAGIYRVRLEVPVDLEDLDWSDGAPEQTIIARETQLSTDGEALVEVPPPVVLLAPLGPLGIEAAVVERWTALGAVLDGGVLSLPLGLPGGTARGAALLDSQVASLLEHLATELGSAPNRIDLVAHGAAGLAARAYSWGPGASRVRKLVLLGTPNLGTARAEPESVAESSSRPPRDLDVGESSLRGNGGGSGGRGFSGAVEQTPAFLRDFNALTRPPRGVEVHLIAGTSGSRLLDPLLGCSSHDERVCEESALGGVPGALGHRVPENHETLGRGPDSVALVRSILLAAVGAGGGLEEPASGEAAGGGGAGVTSSYPTGNSYGGILEAGATGALPLVSDTSESIIIILSSDLPGGIRFRVEEPSGGDPVDPADAGGLPDVEYVTYGDGEGHVVQVFKFAPCEPGTYLALLENPVGGAAVRYTLEAYLAGDLEVQVSVTPEEVQPGEAPVITALPTRKGIPETAARVEARVLRPDGGILIVPMADDGALPDLAAGDGIYTAAVPESDQPGIHQVEITVESAQEPFASYQRESTLWFKVASDVIRLTGEYSSGTEDSANDGVLDSLWVQAGIESQAAGIFLAMGTLTDLAGNPVASSGTIFSLSGAATTSLRLYFSGSDISASRLDGPFLLSDIQLLDGSAGFVPADNGTSVHTTADVAWEQFGLGSAVPYLRADSNGDGKIDISDGIAILAFLFDGGSLPDCRDAADANDDGRMDLSDATFIFLYLFVGGAPIPPPFPACGVLERLGCAGHPACAG